MESCHKKEFGVKPQAIVRVPGVATIMGEFASYCQGKVLCCADGANLFVSLSVNDSGIVQVVNCNTGDRKKFPTSSLKFRKEDKWANSVKGVFSVLNELGMPLYGCDIALSDELLNADSSMMSAAIGVGVLVAYNNACSLGLSDDQVVELVYKSCIKFCNETIKVSTIVAMVHSKSGNYMIFDLGNGSFKYIHNPFYDSHIAVLVVDGNVPPLALREEVNLRHSQAKEAFELLKAKAGVSSLRDFPLEDLTDRVVRVDENTRRTCSAILEDCQMVGNVERMVRIREYSQLGKALSRVAKLMRDDLELSCPEMDWLAKRSTEIAQCYGTGIVFKGNGPSLAMLIDSQAVDAYLNKLEEYDRIFGFKATTTVFEPCSGYEVIKSS